MGRGSPGNSWRSSWLNTRWTALISSCRLSCLRTSIPRTGVAAVIAVVCFKYVSFRYTRLQLDQATREEIGRQAKRVLDYGRLKYLEEVTNLDIKLKYYVDPFISLENALIVCSRPGSTG